MIPDPRTDSMAEYDATLEKIGALKERMRINEFLDGIRGLPWYRRDVYGWPIELTEGRYIQNPIRIVIQNILKLFTGAWWKSCPGCCAGRNYEIGRILLEERWKMQDMCMHQVHQNAINVSHVIIKQGDMVMGASHQDETPKT